MQSKVEDLGFVEWLKWRDRTTAVEKPYPGNHSCSRSSELGDAEAAVEGG